MPSIFSYAGVKTVVDADTYAEHTKSNCLANKAAIEELLPLLILLNENCNNTKGLPLRHIQEELCISGYMAKYKLNKAEDLEWVESSLIGKSNKTKYYKLTKKGLQYVKDSC